MGHQRAPAACSQAAWALEAELPVPASKRVAALATETQEVEVVVVREVSSRESEVEAVAASFLADEVVYHWART